MPIRVLGFAAIGLFAVGIGAVAFILGRNPPSARPTLGARGLKRKRALEDGGSFALLESPMRLVGGWLSGIPMPSLRSSIDRELRHAGEYLGLGPNDFLALSLIGAVGMTLAGLLIVNLAELPSALVLFFSALGAAMPWLQVRGEAERRAKAIQRSLPTAIDLAALCMGAGLDFPASLRQICEKASRNDGVLVEELGRLLQELELGHTRRKALESFASRVPTEAVRDFVATVVQAEAKGTPLAEVLSIQARMLRMRRSVIAEETAAKAGVMMMGPLMMMFLCIVLLLLGPFLVNWWTQGI